MGSQGSGHVAAEGSDGGPTIDPARRELTTLVSAPVRIAAHREAQLIKAGKQPRKIAVIAKDGSVVGYKTHAELLEKLVETSELIDEFDVVEKGARPEMVACQACGAPFEISKGHRSRRYCRTGCKCSCGVRVSRVSVLKAGRLKCVPRCRSCATKEQMARYSVKERTERARKASAAISQDLRKEIGRKAALARSPEQHAEIMRRARAARTPEQLSERARNAWKTRRANAAKKKQGEVK